jgi:hypothetical protein
LLSSPRGLGTLWLEPCALASKKTQLSVRTQSARMLKAGRRGLKRHSDQGLLTGPQLGLTLQYLRDPVASRPVHITASRGLCPLLPGLTSHRVQFLPR